MKACQSKLITIHLIGISTCQAIKQLKQGVQGLEAFAFCVVTVIDEHTKLSGIFLKLLSQDVLESNSPQTKFQTMTFQSQFQKVTVQKLNAEFWTGISSQMINYQLPIRGSIILVIISMTYTSMKSMYKATCANC